VRRGWAAAGVALILFIGAFATRATLERDDSAAATASSGAPLIAPAAPPGAQALGDVPPVPGLRQAPPPAPAPEPAEPAEPAEPVTVAATPAPEETPAPPAAAPPPPVAPPPPPPPPPPSSNTGEIFDSEG